MKLLIEQIARPISQRLATASGAYLTALGVSADNVSIVVAAIPVMLGVLIDLVLRKLY